jgi:hypothetical protein
MTKALLLNRRLTLVRQASTLSKTAIIKMLAYPSLPGRKIYTHKMIILLKSLKKIRKRYLTLLTKTIARKSIEEL